MATVDNIDTGGIIQRRRILIKAVGALGRGGEHVQRCQRIGGLGQTRMFVAEVGNQLFIQGLFARQGALASRQHLVFKFLQFLGDVALGVFQGLAARVFGRHLVGVGLRSEERRVGEECGSWGWVWDGVVVVG